MTFPWQKCCGCFTVKTGSILSGVFTLVWSVIVVIALFSSNIVKRQNVNGEDSVVITLEILWLLLYVVLALASLLVIIGACTRSRKFLMVYIIILLVFEVLLLVIIVTFFINFFSNIRDVEHFSNKIVNRKEAIGVQVGSIVFLIVNAICWVCVLSYYLLLGRARNK